jgi:hypothetical protein
MGFSSLDAVTNELSNNGKTTGAIVWNKITGAAAYAAGRWYDMSGLNGFPVANAYAGTALAWTPCNETTGNGTQIFGIQHGGNVSPNTKHISIASGLSAVAAAVPALVQWVDLQGYWPGINLNLATAQTLTGTPVFRYANAAGVRPYLVNTAAGGATAQNVSMSYTNQAAVAGRALPVTVSNTASAIVGHLLHTGTAANNYGPFMPLQGGDTGVQNVANITLSAAGGAGAAALCLARPIGQPVPIAAVGVLGEREFFCQIPSLPRIFDGACLVPLLFAANNVPASTNFYGSLEAVWGNS